MWAIYFRTLTWFNKKKCKGVRGVGIGDCDRHWSNDTSYTPIPTQSPIPIFSIFKNFFARQKRWEKNVFFFPIFFWNLENFHLLRDPPRIRWGICCSSPIVFTIPFLSPLSRPFIFYVNLNGLKIAIFRFFPFFGTLGPDETMKPWSMGPDFKSIY